jgi:hypothetical protein
MDAARTIFLVTPSALHRTMIPPQAFRTPALRKEREERGTLRLAMPAKS